MSGLKGLVWLSQLGISIVSPLILCLFGSVWLRNRYGLGSWLIVLGLLLGLLGSFSAGLTFYRNTVCVNQKTSKDKPPLVGFNEHD